MRCVAILVAFIVCLAGPAAGEAAGTVVRLGKLTPDNEAAWRDEGFAVTAPSCAAGDAACVEAAIAGDGAKPVYLVADGRQSDTVRALYAAGVTSDKIAGIVLLGAQGQNGSLTAGTDAPPLLVLVATDATKDTAVSSRELAAGLRAKGVKATFLFAREVRAPDLSIHRMTMDIILDFMGHSPFGADYLEIMNVYRSWDEPPIDNADFLADPGLLATYPVDDTLKRLLEVHYKFEPYLYRQWRLDTYTAFDLMAYRARVAPNARYVTLRNYRNQLVYLDLDVYGRYEPVIVVGIDDVTNMYRLAWFYRTKAMYSWKPGVQDVAVRLLGPMLHFRKVVPDELVISVLLRSSLTLDGIAFSDTDPLAPIASFPDSVLKIVTDANNCISCHAIQGLGGRAHHLRAADVGPQGGIGLPLADYSDAVMRAFIYDQTNTANKIGMTPNPLDESLRDEFYAWWKSLRDEEQRAGD